MAINLNDLANALTGAQERPAAHRASRDQYGTIALDAQGTPTVMLDGGEDYAPCTCMVGVHHGDRVMAHVVNHKIVVFANITAPTTDDAQALVAIDKADKAAEAADAAGIAAASAQADATQAKADAATAKTAAQGAVSDAATAKVAANEAKADAKTAKDNAAQAVSDAATAKQAATDATATANGAVTALATVQGVVDQLETDVDELQVHVAMMDAYSDGHGGTIPAGLHVVPTGSGYFLVIANDGTYVYDAQSVLVTKFGESIDFSSTRPQRIGNDTAYVEYYDSDNDGVPDSIRIAGTNLNTEIANFKQTVSETYATKSEAKQTDSDSGKREIVTEDAAELPLLTLTAYGECEQDGTPTPDAPVEIKAVRGVNLVDWKVSPFGANGITLILDSDFYTMSAKSALSTGAWYIRATDVSGVLLTNQELSLANWNAASSAAGIYYGAANSGSFTFALPRKATVEIGKQNSDSTIPAQLEHGKTASPYVPYGCIGVLSHGKNLIDAPNLDISYNGYYADCTYNNKRAGDRPFLLEAGVTYTFSFTISGATEPFGIDIGAGNGDYMRDIPPYLRNLTNGRVSQTFTPTEQNLALGNIFAYRPVVYNSSTQFSISVSDVQLELGTEATEYEPYRESVSYIDLQGHELASLPNGTSDVLNMSQAGAIDVAQNVGVVDMGDLTWTARESKGFYFGRPVTDAKKGSWTYTNANNCIAPGYVCKATRTVFQAADHGHMALWDKTNIIGLRNNDIGSAEALKTSLAGQKLYYELATPITYRLPSITMPTTFDGGSVRVIAEIQPVIDASWWTKAGYETGKAYNDSSADLAALTERVTTAESSITQQAGEIALKANAADTYTKAQTDASLTLKANKATLTSEINASADTVKIDATRVNIEGAAIFTGSGRLSQSSLDGAYDASGAASGAVNALKTDLASSTGTTVIDGGHIATDSLTVGHVSGLQNTLNGKASTTDVANAAKRTYVSIRATAIDYAADTATLEATLYIDGTAKTSGVTYAWLLDGTAISGATSRTYSVPASSGLGHAYSCKCMATI